MKTENKLLQNFLTRLKTLKDPRRKAGQRHEQEFILLIVLFATMSNYLGYRAIGEFAEKHKEELIQLFKPKKKRVPSFSTIRRLLMSIDVAAFRVLYQDWLKEIKASKERLEESNSSASNFYPIDGKAVRGANKASSSDYTHLVSIFSAFDKIVLESAKVDAKSNEIPCVQKMIESSDLKGVIFTLDALHCQKKRLP